MSRAREYHAKLGDELFVTYGVRAFPSDRGLVVSESDYRELQDAVMRDRSIDAVGRGYRLGFGWFGPSGGVFGSSIYVAPDWTCDPEKVAQARFVAALGIRRAVRAIVGWLS